MSHSKTDSMIVGNINTFLKELLPIYDAKVYRLAYALDVRGALNEKKPINKYMENMCVCEQLPLFTCGPSKSNGHP